MSIDKAVTNLSPIERTICSQFLEEKLDYPANLEEFACKKTVKGSYITDLNLATAVQGPFKKKICE